jgi:peptidoglycan/LPS O-acetylase OafA/YrhL
VLIVAWLNGEMFNGMTWRTAAANLTMASWTLNLVVWSLYVEVCVAPLLPVFHRLARANSAYLDLAVVAALIALTVFGWDQLWSRYWFAFYLGMMIETRGPGWASFLARAAGGRRGALVLSYLVLALPLGFADGHWAVAVVQVLGAFSLLSLIVWGGMPRLTRALEHPVLRWNGRISYSFYLWHFFIFTIIAHELYASLAPATLKAYEPLVFAGALVLSVALAFGVAQLSFAYVERPFLQLGRRLETRWREAVAGLRARRSAPGVLAAR